MYLAVLSSLCEESESPLSLNTAQLRKRASSVVGVTAVAVGLLSVACSANATTVPTTTPTTTTTTPMTTSAAASGGGHHEKHDSSGGSGGGGGAAPVQTETLAPSTVTNTETDIQTT